MPFFSPTVWAKQREPLSLVSECEACGLYKECKSPKMPPTGLGRKKVLLIAEAPGENEDATGLQLRGNAGAEVIKMLDSMDISMRKDCWLTNAIICRPMDRDGKNREPSDKEINYCRPNLAKTLKAIRPDVIIPMGKVSMKALIPLSWGRKQSEVSDIGTWVRWQIPCQKLNAWICPTYHPSFLLRGGSEDAAQDSSRASNIAAQFHVRRHLEAAFKLKGRPYETVPDYSQGLYLISSPKEAVGEIHGFRTRELPIAFDFETTTLKPDGPYAEILCCSISDGLHTIAFRWGREVAEAMRFLIKSPVPKIAANMQFEERWCRRFLKSRVNNWVWDTVLCAHWLDHRHGICSLKFQAFVLLGVDDYDYLIEPYRASPDESGNRPNRLKLVEPMELLKYCALDSLLEVLVAQKQGMKA